MKDERENVKFSVILDRIRFRKISSWKKQIWNYLISHKKVPDNTRKESKTNESETISRELGYLVIADKSSANVEQRTFYEPITIVDENFLPASGQKCFTL